MSAENNALVDPKKRLLRNVTSNWVQMAIYSATALIMTPILVHSLGKDAYGIWALIYSIIHYTNFFDVGFKQSLARFLPKYYATRDYDKLNEVVNSSNLIYLISGTLVLATTIVIAAFFVDWFQVPPEMHSLMRIVLIIMGVNHAFYFFLMAGTALGPFHRYDLMNTIEIVKTIVGTAVVIWLVKNGYGLLALAIVTFLSSFGGLLVKRYFQHRIVPEIKYDFRYVNKQRIRELFNYGAVSFLIVMSWIVIFSKDNIVVAKFISLEAVAYFNVAGTIISNLRSIVSAIGIPLVPAISHLDATSDLREIAALERKLNRYLYYMSVLICVGFLFFADDFINQWMGPGFQTTINIMLILIVPTCIFLPQMVSNSVLLGIGKHRALLYVLGLEAVSNVSLSIALVHVWGVYGVALGTAIPQVIIYLFIYPYVFHRAIRASLKDFYRESGIAVITGTIFVLPVAWLANYIPWGGWPGFVLKVGLVSAVGFAGFIWRMLEPNDRRRIFGFLHRKPPIAVVESHPVKEA